METYTTRAKQFENLWDRFCSKITIPSIYLPIRHRLYTQGYLQQARVATPTISIGNLAVGGVGKTPLIIWFMERLMPAKIAVLHSGYGGGDEAKMLQARFPTAFIWSNKKRHLGLEQAYQWGAELILIDDGFQCHRLHRDLDIVVLDASQPLVQNQIPFGRYREPLQALRRADLIVANHVHSAQQATHTINALKKYSQAPILRMKPILESIPEKNSAVFCGLGNPKHFISAIKEQGVPIKTILLALDHETPNPRDWGGFVKHCEKSDVEQILCTEKDLVRIQNLETKIPILAIKMGLELL